MNWIQKISQLKPMALPKPRIQPTYMDGGIEWIDGQMTRDTANWFDKTYPDAEGLGAGNNGIVYRCGPGVACKVTEGEENDIATELMNRPNKGFVEVYSLKQIQEEPELWMTEMEEVNPLDDIETKIWKFMRYNMVIDPMVAADNMTRWGDFDKMLYRVKKLHNDIIQMETSINEGGLVSGDSMNPKNVGRTKKEDRLVVLDIGGSEIRQIEEAPSNNPLDYWD